MRLSIEHPLADAGQRLKLFQEVISSHKQHTEDLVSTIPSGVIVCAPDLSVLSINRACREMLGLADENAGAGLDAILPSAELHNNAIETLMSGLPRRNFSFKAVGSAFPNSEFLVSMARSYRHTEEPCLIISFENVTQLDALRQAETEIRERFDDLFNGSDDSLLLLDERELIVDFNPAAGRNLWFQPGRSNREAAFVCRIPARAPYQELRGTRRGGRQGKSRAGYLWRNGFPIRCDAGRGNCSPPSCAI